MVNTKVYYAFGSQRELSNIQSLTLSVRMVSHKKNIAELAGCSDLYLSISMER